MQPDPSRMDAAETIRNCIADVTALRLLRQSDPALAEAVLEVKQLRVPPLHGHLCRPHGRPHGGTSHTLFLDELYSPGISPPATTSLAALRARCRRCSQARRADRRLAGRAARPDRQLDQAMGHAWLSLGGTPDAARYVAAWRTVGERHARHEQLDSVLTIGKRPDTPDICACQPAHPMLPA
ncbi:MAG: hypothetical protein R3E55_08110 [Burkholderiaceae bacterium]